MSLNQKYTWNDFLRDNPEMKEKGIKRTSSEGKKAFEAAYKKAIKDYLGKRAERCDTEIAKATKRRDGRITTLKTCQQIKNKTKRKIRSGIAQKKVGATDHAIAALSKIKEKTTQLQKTFK